VLRHLQLFRVSHNCLSVLPREMGKMRGLTHLDLGGNRVGNLPYDMRCTLVCACALARAFFHVACHEYSLVLSRFCDTRLTSFFFVVANGFSSALVHLKVLDIRKNQFKTLPDTIQFYTDLRKLNISHNQLLNLGSAIRNCEVLEEIWCQVLPF
jgi:Leucine-rich repeat (LRR) protein